LFRLACLCIQRLLQHDGLPYVAPFGAYMGLLMVQTSFAVPVTWAYPLRTIAAALLLWTFRKRYSELAFHFSPLASLIGLLAIVIWIVIDPFYPSLSTILYGQMPASFDPHTLGSAMHMWTFIAIRVIGAVLVVPFMEELFWRGFLMRWLVNPHFQSVPIGTCTWQAYWITVVLFGVEHEQWVAGLICGALYNWLYCKRKDLFACVLAHAVSNALLAMWVVACGDWKFW
jgi:CAAX prenyl protease-like protein